MTDKPIDDERIARKITTATDIFLECWEILSHLKQKQLGKASPILEFQPKLAQAIYRLDREYDSIRAEERRLIQRKKSIDQKTFDFQIAELAHFRGAIEQTARIGRGLGDAFAWLFFLGTPELLSQQAGRPRVGHTPPGLGGTGELAFVRTFPKFKSYFPLYHGITSLLRSGDFSLVDLRSFKVAGLIELKTTRVDSRTLRFSINAVGSQKLDDLTEGFNLEAEDNFEIATPPKVIPGFRERLERQMRTMGSVLEPRRAGAHAELRDAYHIDELRQLSKSLEIQKSAYQQVGPGLLLMASHTPQAPIAARLLQREAAFDAKAVFPDLVQNSIKLMSPRSPDNSITISQFDFTLLLGGTPLFWWPVDHKFLFKIYFQELWVGTLFNPIHFAEKLRARGFEVTTHGKPNEWVVRKRIGQMEAKVECFPYFLSAIAHHLMREDGAVNAIETALQTAQERPGTRVQLNFNHMML